MNKRDEIINKVNIDYTHFKKTYDDRLIVSLLLNQESLDMYPLKEWQRELSNVSQELGFATEFLVILPEDSKHKLNIISSDYDNHPTQVVFYNGVTGWDEDMLQLLAYANGDYIHFVIGELDSQKNTIRKLYSHKEGHDVVACYGETKISPTHKFIAKQINSNLNEGNLAKITRNVLLSRTAVNWLVGDGIALKNYYEIYFCENLRYKFLENSGNTNDKNIEAKNYKLPKSHAAYLLLNFSKFPSNILKVTFFSNLLFFILFSFNALVVRIFEKNIFGSQEVQVKGWATIVILISFGFLTVTTLLYVGLSTYIHDLSMKRINSKRISKKIYRLTYDKQMSLEPWSKG